MKRILTILAVMIAGWGVTWAANGKEVAQLMAQLDSAQQLGKRQYCNFLKDAEDDFSSPESPRHNEQLWIVVLQHELKSTMLSDNDKMRPRLQLEEAMRNAIGTKAANIDLQLKDGTRTTLDSVAKAAPLTLLYFANPDCEACQRTKERLEQSTVIKQMVETKELQVVAIYPFDNERLWRESEMPPFVTDTWNYTLGIDEQQSYVLPSFPLFYLLKRDMTVLMKNEASLRRIEAELPGYIDSTK